MTDQAEVLVPIVDAEVAKPLKPEDKEATENRDVQNVALTTKE